MPCVIFSGGKSSRMLEDKSLLPFGGFDTLIEYQYSKLSKIFSDVYISSKNDNFSFTCKTILDEKNVYAPTIGFVSIFNALHVEKVFVLSVDTPFVGRNEIKRIVDIDEVSFDASIAKTAFGSHPLCGVYHRSLLSEFKKMLAEDNHKLGFLLKNSKTHWVDFEEEDAFSNLNHPHEYQEALLRLSLD